ncbi:hypothetical protein HDU67_002422, partial [Dinochytrium kinnereticum]
MVGNLNRSDSFVLNAGINKCLKTLSIPEAADKIVCCEVTQSILSGSTSISTDAKRFSFPTLGKFMVRGSAKTTTVIEVVDTTVTVECWNRSRGPRQKPVGVQKHRDLILDSFTRWRQEKDVHVTNVEQKTIISAFADLKRHDASTWTSDNRYVFMVVGTPGHGKTLLANEILHEFKKCQTTTSSVNLLFASSIPDHGPRVTFGSLRRCILQIAQSVCKTDLGTGRLDPFSVLNAAAKEVGVDWRFAAVTAAVLGPYSTSVANGWADEISPKDRVDVAIATIIAIIQYGCAIGKRYSWIVDDFQWLDACSTRLLYRIARDCSQVFTVILTRPISEPGIPEAEYTRIVGLPGVHLIELEPLTAQNIAELLANQWGGRGAGIKKVDMALCEMIYRTTSGDPLFTSLLCKILRTRSSVGKLQPQGTGAGTAYGGGSTANFDSLVLRAKGHSSMSAGQPTKMSMEGTGHYAQNGFAFSHEGGNNSGDNGARRMSSAQQAASSSTKEDLPSPLVIDDDGILRSRRWPALDLSGANFVELLQGIFERAGYNLRRVFAAAATFGQGFTIEDIMAGIEGPATVSEVLLSFDEDSEGLIVQ